MPLADDVLRKLEEGRAEAVRGLRTLVERLERLDLHDAGEALTWIERHLRKLREEAERILRRDR